MTDPVTPITSMAKANSQLALKLAEIMRENSQTCMQLGSKTVTSLSDQLKSMAPGKMPEAKDAMAADFLKEMEGIRDGAMEKTKAAFEEWQESWSEIWSEVSDQNQWGDMFKSFLGSIGKIGETKPAPKPKSTRAASKSAETE